MRSVLQEMRELFEANEIEALKDDKAKAAMMLRHTSSERNKRCLLAYLNYRIEKIRDMRWQFGAVLPSEVKVFHMIINTCHGLISQIAKTQTFIVHYFLISVLFHYFRQIFANQSKHFSRNTTET